MTKEELETANEINTRVEDLESIISSIERGEKNGERPVLNWLFDYKEDGEAFKNASLLHLKSSLKTLQDKFNKL